MRQAIIGTAIFLVGLGAGYGFVQVTESSNSVDDDHSTGEHLEHVAHDHMEHSLFNVQAEMAPTVNFSVTEDAKSGWNIRINTTDFVFSPENVNKENVVGEGHAHLYVNGEKVARLYGPDYHYYGNFDGTKTFKVTLNANDHSEYAVDGEVISATQEVTHSAHN